MIGTLEILRDEFEKRKPSFMSKELKEECGIEANVLTRGAVKVCRSEQNQDNEWKHPWPADSLLIH